MNPAFLILILLVAFLLWVALYPQFKSIGNAIWDIADEIKEIMFGKGSDK